MIRKKLCAERLSKASSHGFVHLGLDSIGSLMSGHELDAEFRGGETFAGDGDL
jgi:hypothetical protein